MKDLYILYRDIRPENHHEVLNVIRHFCAEREINCHIPDCAGNRFIRIEDRNYRIQVKKETDGSNSAYWAIYCSLCRNDPPDIHTNQLFLSASK